MEKLEQLKKQPQVLNKIDHWSNTCRIPERMLFSTIKLIAKILDADTTGLLLRDRDTGESKLNTIWQNNQAQNLFIEHNNEKILPKVTLTQQQIYRISRIR
ncbi:hypothetical protein JW935_08070 [candidate division KSB1 bacterium]|nr:hypothetical protein [candidate division KSB1 bacterium]